MHVCTRAHPCICVCVFNLLLPSFWVPISSLGKAKAKIYSSEKTLTTEKADRKADSPCNLCLVSGQKLSDLSQVTCHLYILFIWRNMMKSPPGQSDPHFTFCRAAMWMWKSTTHIELSDCQRWETPTHPIGDPLWPMASGGWCAEFGSKAQFPESHKNEVFNLGLCHLSPEAYFSMLVFHIPFLSVLKTRKLG